MSLASKLTVLLIGIALALAQWVVLVLLAMAVGLIAGESAESPRGVAAALARVGIGPPPDGWSSEARLVVLMLLVAGAAAITVGVWWLFARAVRRGCAEQSLHWLQAADEHCRLLAQTAGSNGHAPPTFDAVRSMVGSLRGVIVRRAEWIAGGLPILALALAISFWLHAALTTTALLLATLIGILLYRWREHRQHQLQLTDDEVDRRAALCRDAWRRGEFLHTRADSQHNGHPPEQPLEQFSSAELARDVSRTAERPLTVLVIVCGGLLVAALAGVNMLRVPPRIVPSECFLMLGLWAATLPWLGRWLADMQLTPAAVERAAPLVKLLSVETAADDTVSAAPRLAREIQLDAVSLDDRGYDDSSRVSLRIAAGACAAVMTEHRDALERLAQALLSGRPNYGGRVFVDGQDLAQCSLSSWRRQVTVVRRDQTIFPGTVTENIACGDDRFSALDVYDAAKAADAYEFVQQLPLGFATAIGDHGLPLEPAQAYRIGLARVLLQDPSLVLLEEPDATSDAMAQFLDELLQRVAHDRTVIVLSPRLSTLRVANTVLVLDDAKFVAAGPHAELLQQCDLYRHLNYLRFNPFRRTSAQAQV